MINNEFRIIGVALSDFIPMEYKNFVSYKVIVEVEKMGSKYGNHFELPVVFYKTNRAINPDIEIKGHQVTINGYMDTYVPSDCSPSLVKLVGQNLFVVDGGRIKNIVDDDSENIFSIP